MKFAWAVTLLVLLFASILDARRRDETRMRAFDYGTNECTPCKEYQLSFKQHTNTDYAILENSIVYNLKATTVCFFARSTDNNPEPGQIECVYSYAIPGLAYGNELVFCTFPKLEVTIHGNKRTVDASLDLNTWNHICFTWDSINGDYQIYKDGMLVGSGSGMSKDGKITSGGTTVIGQDQDTVGGGFEVKQSFVGDVTEVNVWGTVLSESDILAQYHNCHITIGSVNEWRDFEDGVQGDTEVIPPSC